MSLSVGIVGLPNIGKTTLFNALTRAGAEASNYPFCTIDRNIGFADVPDSRLARLNEVLTPKECTPATLQFTDVAGLVRGASRGEGLGNKFLAHIREVDAILHVVRCFANEEVAACGGEIDPVKDLETVNTELILADLDCLDRAAHQLKKRVGGGDDPGAKDILHVVDSVRDVLSTGRAAKEAVLSEEARACLLPYNLLTSKPVIHVANVDDAGGHDSNSLLAALQSVVGRGIVVPIAARLEDELLDLPEEDRAAFLSDLGYDSSGLDRIVAACYECLGLITFYTTVNQKLRAWPTRRGTSIWASVGKIHSDIQRGFIRAEVATCTDLVACGSVPELHRRGLLKTEGRDYVVQDGDVVHVLFKV